MQNLLSIPCSFDGLKSAKVLSFFLFQPEEHYIALNVFSSDGFFELRKLAFRIFKLQSQGFNLLPATLIRHLLGIVKMLEFFFEPVVIFLHKGIIQLILGLVFRLRLGC